jgi:peroxiredoxin
VERFAKEKAVNYTLVMGSTDDLDALTGKPGSDSIVPTTFLIGRDGQLVHAKRGDYGSARKAFQRALALDPEDPRAKANLEELDAVQKPR